MKNSFQTSLPWITETRMFWPLFITWSTGRRKRAGKRTRPEEHAKPRYCMQLAPEMSLTQFGKRGHNRYLPLGFCSGPAGPVLTDFLLKCHKSTLCVQKYLFVYYPPYHQSLLNVWVVGRVFAADSSHTTSGPHRLACTVYIVAHVCTNVCNEKNQLHAKLCKTLTVLMRRKSAMIKKETRVNFSMPKELNITPTMGSAPVTTPPILCEFLWVQKCDVNHRLPLTAPIIHRSWLGPHKTKLESMPKLPA